MGKIRIYELAKEAGIESKVLTAQLIELGYKVKTHSSSLDEDAAEEVRVQLGLKKKVRLEEKRIEKKGRTIIRRRKKKPAEPEAEEPVVEVAVEGESVADPEPITEPEKIAEPEIVELAEEPSAEAVVEDGPVEPVAEDSPVAPVAEDSPVGPVAEEAESEKSAAEVIAEDADKAEAVEDVEPVIEDVVSVTVEEAEPAVEAEAEEKPEKELAQEKPRKKTKGKKPISRVIGMSKIPLPVEEARTRPKPKKAVKKKAAPAARSGGEAAADSDKDRPKGKKGKRFVKFSREEAPARGKKGRRKGQVVIEAEDIGRFGGRISSEVRLGRQGGRGGRKKKKQEEVEVSETRAIKKRIKVTESIVLGDFAHRMGVKVNELIAKLMGMGVMATLNQSLDVDTATLVASDFGYEVEQGVTEEQSIINLEDNEVGGEELPRAPVVTVMGHVDHGKTSILDAIRNTDVAAGEAGGITQHIGAHYVRSPQGDLVFLDTPGHAAFTEMRSRGAQITDVVVLVVAADDGVMDQTKEAINHARAAGVPILVAVNKIDKEDADPSRVQRELAELDLLPEDWGGETIYCETSAKQGTGIDSLVENILLQTEILELKANADRRAKGWVVEAQLHKGRGAVATVLVKQGTVRVGDHFVVGQYSGKVRSLSDDKGSKVKKAGPSTPVEVQGLNGVPLAGDEFVVVPDEKMAKSVSQDRQMRIREQELASGSKISLENLFDRLQEGEVKELRVLLRADVQGTLEAFTKSIEDLSTDDIKVKVLHSGTGTVVESDILLAAASEALIIGFNVRPSLKVKEMAKAEGVDMRFYDVIYHALDDIKKAMTGMLEPTFVEKVIGSAEVRETFQVPKIGTIAGSYVIDGKIDRNGKVRLLRDGVVIYTGQISSLRRFKDDAREVQAGYECGIGVENYNDIKVGDQLEVFIMEEVAATL